MGEETDVGERNILSYAVESGKVEMAKLCIEKFGITASIDTEQLLYDPAARDNKDMIRYLASRYSNSTILGRLAQFDELTMDMLELFIYLDHFNPTNLDE
jgi:hypothetical protein